jgi:hypothetical protein
MTALVRLDYPMAQPFAGRRRGRLARSRLVLLVSPVVRAAGAGLMAATPPGPGQHESGLDRHRPDQCHQQAANLGDGERDQLEPAGQAGASPFARSLLVAWVRVTARKAWASSARVMCRYQPGQRRTS